MNAIKLSKLALFAVAIPYALHAQKNPHDAASQMNYEFEEGKAKLVRKCDHNQNGKIDADERKEFINAVADLRISLQKKFSHDDNGKPVATPAMRQTFQSLDRNGDGKLDSSETTDSPSRNQFQRKTVESTSLTKPNKVNSHQ